MSVSSTESGNTKSTKLSSHTSSHKKVGICRQHAEFSASRLSSIFSEKLEKVNKRFRHFRVSKGISDSISIRNISNGTSQLNFNEAGGNCHSGPGNPGKAEERCNKISPNQHKKPVSKLSIFIVPKKDSGHRSVIYLNKLNKHIPYIHFKMEDLFLLKETLLRGDYICKANLKDAYFSVPLNPKSQI